MKYFCFNFPAISPRENTRIVRVDQSCCWDGDFISGGAASWQMLGVWLEAGMLQPPPSAGTSGHVRGQTSPVLLQTTQKVRSYKYLLLL